MEEQLQIKMQEIVEYSKSIPQSSKLDFLHSLIFELVNQNSDSYTEASELIDGVKIDYRQAYEKVVLEDEDLEFDENFFFDRKSDTEISEVITELTDYIWYNRHQCLFENVITGKETVDPKIWSGALKSAQRMEEKYGDRLFQHEDNFEWGMINGKLSALRWVFGDEWDMLDT